MSKKQSAAALMEPPPSREFEDAVGTGPARMDLAERLMFKIAAEGRSPTVNESLFFNQVGWDDRAITLHHARLCRVAAARELCPGGEIEMEERRRGLERAQKVVEVELPQIEAKIAALQEQRGDLVRQVNLAESALARAETAKVAMIKNAPPHLKKISDLRITAIQKEFAWLSQIHSEMKWRASVLANPILSRRDELKRRINHIEARSLNGDTRLPQIDRLRQEVDDQDWDKYQNRLRSELAELQSKFDAGARLREQAMSQAADPLETYWREL